MGFDVWVAENPELHGREPCGFPHFSINNRAMRDLREEMRAQGLLDPYLEYRLSFNQGEEVSAEEIHAVLARAGENSVTMPDEEGQEMWRSWLAFLREAVGHGGIVVW
jgi:hypothetical protein